MNRNEVFGELRGLLFRPSKENWDGLCALIATLPVEQQRQEVIPYLQHHLLRWPAEICMAPWSWVEPLFRGEPAPPALALARAIEIRKRKKVHYGFKRFIQSDAIAHIESLKIDETSIGGKRSFEALTQATQLQKLSMLSLERVRMEDEHLEALIQAGHVHGVKELHLEGNHLTPQSVAMLVAHDFVLNLEELHLDGNPIGVNGCVALSLAPFQNLKVLSLGTTHIGDEGLETLSQSDHFRQVTRLEFAQCDIGPSGVAALVNGAAWDSVDTLSIWSNHVGGDGLRHIADRDGMPTLAYLGLSNNGIDDAGVVALAKSSWCEQLRKLDLRLNAIGESGCEALGESPYFEDLDALFLSFNPCYSEGINRLLASPSFSKIRQLELANTRLYEPKCLGQCAQLSQLEELELTGNYLSGNLNGLVGNQPFEQLRMLGLDHCHLYSEDLRPVLDGLALPNLIALYLSRNMLSTDGIDALLARSFERLMLVDIEHNDDVDPLLFKAVARRYRMEHKKRVWSSGSSLHYTLSILEDAAEPVWEQLAHEALERRKLRQQLGTSV